MRNKRIIIIALFIMTLITVSLVNAAEFVAVPSGSLSVQHDDGNGTLFKELPVNYARLNRLSLNDAIIVSGSGYTICDAQSGYNSRETRPHLVWYGKVKFGGEGRTANANAVTTANSLPEVTLKFPGGATLSDGTSADVIVKMDKISVNLTKSYNSNITNNTNVYVMIASSDTSGLWMDVTSPKTAIDRWDYTNANKSSSSGVGTKLRVTIKLTETASGSTIGDPVSSDDYPCMLVEYKDLDVRDHFIKSSASYTEKWNGKYAEGVEFLTGWGNPVVLAPMGEGILNQSLLDKQMADGNTKIKGKGSQYQALENLTGSANDIASFYSGVAAPAATSGFSFCWTGSVPGGNGSSTNIATLISGQPTVAVRAKRSEGGSLGNTDIGAYSGLNIFFNNTHLMNSAATYYFKPEDGWEVEYLKVDGEVIELSSEEKTQGGSYDFIRLNKNPVAERVIQDGNILDATDNGFYEIEVKYIRSPAYSTEKSVSPETIYSMSNDPVTYTIHCEETIDGAASGSHQIRDNLANGLLEIVPGSVNVTVSDNCTYAIDKNDAEGLWVTFNSCKAAETKPGITITYQATVNWENYEAGSIVNHADGDDATLKPVSNIDLVKEVKGKLRDTVKQFAFTAELEGLDPAVEYQVSAGNSDAFTSVSRGTKTETGFLPDAEGKAELKLSIAGGQSITLRDLPIGSRYRINENASNHIPSFIQTSNQQNPVFAKSDDSTGRNNTSLSTEWEIINKQDGQITVTFINSRDPEPVTGITTTDWFRGIIGVIALSAVSATVYLVRRRKQDPEGGEL